MDSVFRFKVQGMAGHGKEQLARAYNRQAAQLWGAGDLSSAIACWDRALALKPDFAEVHNNKGLALYQRGEHAAAIRSWDRALAIRPNYAEAHNNKGLALCEQGNYAQAVACCNRALAGAPDHVGAHYNKGLALSKMGDFSGAIASYDRALSLRPDLAEAHCNKGLALCRLGDAAAAVASCDRALALRPDFAEAHNNMGLALFDQGTFASAVESYDRALALRPDYAEAHCHKGLALQEQADFTAALDSYDFALSLKPDLAEAHANKGRVLLQLGRFAEGWREYEWRWRVVGIGGPRDLTAPLWTGAEDLTGRTILIHAEQGIGDTIQFCRYLPLVVARGARILFGLRPNHTALEALMGGLVAGLEIVDWMDADLSYDYHCPLMSLPLAFDTERETVPADIPYLMVDAESRAAWAARIGMEGFRIGICWQGNPAHARDRWRSFPLSLFAGIAAVPGVRLINLHKGTGESQIAMAPFAVENFSDEINARSEGFLATAAIASCCDLIISCDSSVAHLAGALGLPVWIVVDCSGEWRWLTDRTDSLWYPTARLFRQPEHGNWDAVFAAMRAGLSAMVADLPAL